jgi:DAK2 domain fusion protein YloV
VPEGRQGPEGALTFAREFVGAALTSLEANRERIDNLNVFPVPDGDTGTNMTLTVRAARDALAASDATEAEDVAREVVRACLMGARGNSGVILSQIVRGAAEALAQAEDQAAAFRAAAEAGYASVREPQEGTILTVARALADRAEQARDEGVEQGEALARIVDAGEEALALTKEQLPILRQAGVVDAGGAGLLELVRGIALHLRGEPLPEVAAGPERLPLESVHLEPSAFRYCTSFFLEGDGADPDQLELELQSHGDSLLVVGSPGAVKVHLHTNDPGQVLSLATDIGVVDEVDIKNMHTQIAERDERILSVPAKSDVVAVVAGSGNERLFRSLGAAGIIEGGQTMNPAASAILKAAAAVGAPETIVLPNNPNVLLTARHAAALSSSPVVVVPTESLQAGLAALVAYDPSRSAAENAEVMEAAAKGARTGSVTRASRSTRLGALDVEEGSFLGLVEGEPVTSGPVLDTVAREVIERLLGEGSDVLTVVVGDGVEHPDGLRAELEAAHPELEIEVYDGGQPHYPLLFSAE